MGQVRCRRCDADTEGLGAAPLPGEPGELVLAGTCPACWSAWRGEQVKLINENQLAPSRPDHYDFLVQRMKGFLKLEG
jgi:Fe-S cluster biosynthesis and repair protein YggX